MSDPSLGFRFLVSEFQNCCKSRWSTPAARTGTSGPLQRLEQVPVRLKTDRCNASEQVTYKGDHGRSYDTIRIFHKFEGRRPPPTPSTKSIF